MIAACSSSRAPSTPSALPVRVQFEGVAPRPHAGEPGDPRYVSGKLLYKESPFSWWIRSVSHAAEPTTLRRIARGPRRRRAARHQQRADPQRPPRRARRSPTRPSSGSPPTGSPRSQPRSANSTPRWESSCAANVARHTGAAGCTLESAHKWVQATEWGDIDLGSAEAHLTGKQDELSGSWRPTMSSPPRRGALPP
jgi:hypothetical protein